MQSISAADVSRRVRETIREVFRLSPEEAGGDLRLGSPPRWDSLGHMELLVSVISRMTTVDEIIRAVQTHARSQP